MGKEPVKLADGVTATIAGRKVTVKGEFGELSYTMQGGITAKVEDVKAGFLRPLRGSLCSGCPPLRFGAFPPRRRSRRRAAPSPKCRLADIDQIPTCFCKGDLSLFESRAGWEVRDRINGNAVLL
ncbi:MAG: 50S ribosomal protein L6 [bacterium]|nr:50S ribosomal protein L6 [Candidatus Colisoma equi]